MPMGKVNKYISCYLTLPKVTKRLAEILWNREELKKPKWLIQQELNERQQGDSWIIVIYKKMIIIKNSFPVT